MELERFIRDIPDFPKEGIVFKDITPVLADPEAMGRIIELLAERYKDAGITKIVGIESRGFIFGAPLALRMGIGFVPARKPGKLPAPTYSASYDLEYGSDEIHVHQDALDASDRAVVIDDLVATGGTARAAAELVERCGATLHEVAVVIELGFLEGRAKVSPYPLHALLTY